jgi:hypothetical protein
MSMQSSDAGAAGVGNRNPPWSAGMPPSHSHAGVCSAVSHDLKATKAIGTDDADKVSKQMRQ